MDEPLSAERKAECYRIFAASLAELDLDGVELIPQTMAPFPWHFGGQRHQNIFIFPEESAAFCAKHNLRMCVDISHTKLAANHFGFDFAKVSRSSARIPPISILATPRVSTAKACRSAKAKSTSTRSARILRKHAPGASFIPEIWQGHKNMGEGFWTALERLEGRI